MEKLVKLPLIWRISSVWRTFGSALHVNQPVLLRMQAGTQSWIAANSTCSRRFLATLPQLGPQIATSIPANQEPGRITVPAEDVEEVDKLYKMIELELKGHEDAVLDSYQWFLCRAAKELGIQVSRTYQPLRIYRRHSILKSIFTHKKHFVQYEIRTYFRVIQLKHMTGSTADTYLEYVQRNLPEGVAMKVIKCSIEEIPSHFDHSALEEETTSSDSIQPKPPKQKELNAVQQ